MKEYRVKFRPKGMTTSETVVKAYHNAHVKQLIESIYGKETVIFLIKSN